ncbi:hypothetical protein [Pararhodobacter sp.]|uniref:hypothetical protein n=1 Tax=Pararhodobacter sp. TaxID=2127056 RepID=UPI002AFE731E|nr:hypothetical protein [Pararhodobacter sp.]
MPRTALALAATATLMLNGSMASATMPATSHCGDVETVCVISLRMMEAPPQRPVDLMTRHGSAEARLILASAPR